MKRPTEGKRKRGRPPAGLQPGERVRSYERLAIRLPPQSKAALMALATITRTPAWRILHAAIERTVEALPPGDKALLKRLVARQTQAGEGEGD